MFLWWRQAEMQWSGCISSRSDVFLVAGGQGGCAEKDAPSRTTPDRGCGEHESSTVRRFYVHCPKRILCFLSRLVSLIRDGKCQENSKYGQIRFICSLVIDSISQIYVTKCFEISKLSVSRTDCAGTYHGTCMSSGTMSRALILFARKARWSQWNIVICWGISLF